MLGNICFLPDAPLRLPVRCDVADLARRYRTMKMATGGRA